MTFLFVALIVVKLMFVSDIVFPIHPSQKPKSKKESRLGVAYKMAWKERDRLEIELNRSRIATLDEDGQLIRLQVFNEH